MNSSDTQKPEAKEFTVSYTWSNETWSNEPLFTKKQMEKITKKATRLQKFKLLFKPTKYTFDNSDDGNYMLKYKEMDGIIFVKGFKEYDKK